MIEAERHITNADTTVARRERGFDEEARERIKLFEYICWLSIATSAATVVSLVTVNYFLGKVEWVDAREAIIVTLYTIFALILARKNKLFPAIILVIAGTVFFTSVLIYRWEGIYSPFAIYYTVAILITATFLSARVTLWFALVCVIVYTGLILGQLLEWLPQPRKFSAHDMTIIALIGRNSSFIAVALLAQMLARLVATRGRAVSDSERRYRDLVESAPDMILSFNAAGAVVDVNQRACDVLGYTREEMLGKIGTDLVWDEDKKTIRAYFVSLLKIGSPRMIEVEMIDRQGVRIPVEVNHSIVMEDGKPAGIRAMVRDIGPRRRLQQEQDKLRERVILSEKLASIGQLVLGISHEYNNILAGLRGMAEVARMQGRETRLYELPGSIIQLVDRAQQVTSSLLGFARRFDPSLAEVSIYDLVNDVYRLSSYALNMHRINFVKSVPVDLKIYTEAGKLQEVLLNLVINAQHAMEEGGTLTIRASSDGRLARIIVSDTGIGIPPENLSRIFDPFFTTKGPIGGGEQPGSGLGLSLSYGIIQSLGGDISVKSEPGKGATFTVILPVHAQQLTEKTDENASKAELKKVGDITGSKVLIVEDEPAIRETLSEFLEGSGHSVVSVGDGEEGLKALDRERFDIAFVDLLMPLVPGEEFLFRAHSLQPGLAFVIITGREISQDENIKGLSEFPGVKAVLRKPFPFEKAAEIIAALPVSQNE